MKLNNRTDVSWVDFDIDKPLLIKGKDYDCTSSAFYDILTYSITSFYSVSDGKINPNNELINNLVPYRDGYAININKMLFNLTPTSTSELRMYKDVGKTGIECTYHDDNNVQYILAIVSDGYYIESGSLEVSESDMEPDDPMVGDE
jgi:hypothetical protein